MRPVITIITDCCDDNARMRQTRRVQALMGVTPDFCGVDCSFGAAGNLVDALDAGLGSPGVVLVNVAPRHAEVRVTNGTPFCYFCVGHTIVVSTLGGQTLSLVCKFGLVSSVRVLDLAEAAAEVIADEAERTRAISSQFRSYDFTPYVATHLLKGQSIRAVTPMDLPDNDEDSPLVWHVDSFGNVKTSITSDELDALRPSLASSVSELRSYQQLRNVPTGELAWVTGSSGYGNRRFCELVIGGKEPLGAAGRLRLQVGSSLLASVLV